MIGPEDFRFFLDSGAYSAWSRGAQIDLDEYIAFIKANIEHIDVYANLDVIAGVPGRHATRAERNDGAARSWDNFLRMRAEGLEPIPVFHAGEDWCWLENMLDHDCDYIGLGGIVGLDTQLRRSWLDEVFTRITDERGMPIVKTHGFGMTAIPLIFRYPWYSVDSTTWIKLSMTGSIALPALRDGAFVFDEVPQVVSVSDRSPKASEDGKHVNSMSPTMRAIVERWLAECGKSVAEVQDHYYHRAVCNVTFFQRVSQLATVRPFLLKGAIRKQTFF